MTERHIGYVVVLDKAIREDNAEGTINAIKMIKGVSNVEPVKGEVHGHLAFIRARDDLRFRIWEAIMELTSKYNEEEG